ncbi:MAG: membrane protein insertase YidC [Deltaproteobacteria bacterium]|nr:membrane protein insertase YidC [Deltaproteobacteria bacterium]
MEQGRVLIAIALSFVVFIGWNFFFVEKPEVKQQQPAELAASAAEQKLHPGSSPGVPAEKSTDAFVQPEQMTSKDIAEARTITVATPLYTVRLSEDGAILKSFKLENYREQAHKNAAKKELIEPENNGQNLKMSFSGNSLAGLETAVFDADALEDTIHVTRGTRTVTFTWQSESGVVIEKRFSFSPETYLIDMNLVVKNGSMGGFTDSVTVEIQKQYGQKNGGYAFEGPSALLDGKLEQVKIKKIEDKNALRGSFGWIALEDRYFMRSLIPAESADGLMKLAVRGERLVVSKLQRPERVFHAGETVSYDYKIFFGPKRMALLNNLGFDLGKAVQFGMFSIIAKPLLWFMNLIYSVIPNYGVAIILLTIVTKILLWPLGNKSYKSMNEMKKIQPLMAELREKYKNDKKQMNQELMALYKTYKINPMGGCLPMVLQIPVFFALYRMLYQAIELRHTPFMFWINDLSAPDRLFNFDITIPFMQPPFGIPVLTLVMGATMFLQQKMSPPPGDPTQAKMMMLMPVVFTFIFINFSSGLVLYWLVNNVLSIGQQYYIQKKFA